MTVLVAGVDEAGRGPLAGPVVAAAVILDPVRPIDGLADSKKLSERSRCLLEGEILDRALCWAVAEASVEEIDRYNILQASLLAMRRAVLALEVMPGLVKVDGNHCPELPMPAEAVIGGDRSIDAISAASILAKQARDRILLRLHDEWPQYHFDRHKGYPTRLHYEMLRLHGACPHHRRSFRPVQAVLDRDD